MRNRLTATTFDVNSKCNESVLDAPAAHFDVDWDVASVRLSAEVRGLCPADSTVWIIVSKGIEEPIHDKPDHTLVKRCPILSKTSVLDSVVPSTVCAVMPVSCAGPNSQSSDQYLLRLPAPGTWYVWVPFNTTVAVTARAGLHCEATPSPRYCGALPPAPMSVFQMYDGVLSLVNGPPSSASSANPAIAAYDVTGILPNITAPTSPMTSAAASDGDSSYRYQFQTTYIPRNLMPSLIQPSTGGPGAVFYTVRLTLVPGIRANVTTQQRANVTTSDGYAWLRTARSRAHPVAVAAQYIDEAGGLGPHGIPAQPAAHTEPSALTAAVNGSMFLLVGFDKWLSPRVVCRNGTAASCAATGLDAVLTVDEASCSHYRLGDGPDALTVVDCAWEVAGRLPGHLPSQSPVAYFTLVHTSASSSKAALGSGEGVQGMREVQGTYYELNIQVSPCPSTCQGALLLRVCRR